MASDKNITKTNEEFGNGITQQEIQDCKNDKIELSDESLEGVSGGMTFKCWKCGSPNIQEKCGEFSCESCGTIGNHIRTYV